MCVFFRNCLRKASLCPSLTNAFSLLRINYVGTHFRQRLTATIGIGHSEEDEFLGNQPKRSNVASAVNNAVGSQEHTFEGQ